MEKMLLSGNEAVAYGALAAGVKTVAGYPGTPSTEMIESLLKMDLPGTNVEWSTNEKVAFEVAAGGALLGYPTMCTMKMTGVNVAYDSLISIAYSGCTGALVIYVVDDPGVSAGMAEQDTRGFALISDLPVLERSTLQEDYDMTKYAFKLAKAIQGPVFLRSVTSLSQSHGVVEVEPRVMPETGHPLMERNMDKYTKAGAKICMDQHQDLLNRLTKAGEIIAADGINQLHLGAADGAGVIAVGVANAYLKEACQKLAAAGVDVSGLSILALHNTLPYDDEDMKKLLGHCQRILVAEELEPYTENRLVLDAYQLGRKVEIFGKNDGTYSRINYYNAETLIRGLCKLLGVPVPARLAPRDIQPEANCAARPITVCAGCPHRGTYIAMEEAIQSLGLKKSDVVITGDIGCTILGTTPPFEVLWTEVAMGASIPLAQGVVYAGTEHPVLASIGDSTFFHAGMPGLVNALQHNINLTLVIMDNYWTAMTGMQINANTMQSEQIHGWHALDLEQVLKGLGVPDLKLADPYDTEDMAAKLADSMQYEGVSVVLARRECAIQARRRKVTYTPVKLIAEKCVKCKRCITISGCPALQFEDGVMKLDPTQCNGCGICTDLCKPGALVKEG